MDCRVIALPDGLPEKFDLANLDETSIIDVEGVLRLIVDAKQWAPKPSAPRAEKARAKTRPDGEGELIRDEAMLRFLIERESLSLDGRTDWIRLGMATKASRGELGFPLWKRLSSEAEGYEPDKIEKEWRSFGERSPDQPRITLATYYALAKDLGWVDPSGGKGGRRSADRSDGASPTGGDGGPAGGMKKGTSPASHAVMLALDAEDDFWLDLNDKPHVTYAATLPNGGSVLRHAPVSSETYGGILKARFHEDVVNNVLTSDQAKLATELLSAEAWKSGERHTAALRVGGDSDRLFVDLGRPDGAAVEIDKHGWRVVPTASVRFVRGTRGELPEPEQGCTLEDFKDHFNVSPEDLLRTLGFIVGTFNVSGSYCLFMTDGPQGSGKSNFNDKIVNLVDPPKQFKGARMAFTHKEQDLHIGALGVHLVYFDNVSSFSAEAADALCRMSTGGGSGARTLYTDTGYTEISVIRPVIVTSIGSPSSRPDLLSRSLRVTALPFGAGHRRTERKIVEEFLADRPKLLGFIFTCVAAAIRNRKLVEDAVETGQILLPRMADFAEFVEGAYEVMGLQLGGFSKLLDGGQKAMQTEAVLGTPVGTGLVRYFSEPASLPISASASDILELLRKRLGSEVRLPQPNGFGKAMSRISEGLRYLGIEWSSIAAEGHENVKLYEINATNSFQPIEYSGLPVEDAGGGQF